MERNAKGRRAHDYDNPVIDRYAHSHLNRQAVELNTTLSAALDRCIDKDFPDFSAIPSQGKFLMLQCRMLGVRHVLEIGTFAGLGTIWCAAASPDIRITTIEMNAMYAKVAKENLRAAGVENRVELLVGKAQDLLPTLAAEIERGEREKFGLVFIDLEDMEMTWDLLDKSLGLCLKNACILAHCCLRKSNLDVEPGEEKQGMVKGSRLLIENVGKDERLDGVLFMTVGEQFYDLLVAAIK